jgi:hypothetical protein
MWFHRRRPDLARLEAILSVFADALAANTAAVSENTTQVGALIAKINDPAVEPTPDQIAALNANTAAITANNEAATNALNPVASEAPAAS